MADYTLLNLRNDVEDMAPKFQMGEGIEAHFARTPRNCEKSGLSYFKLGPDYRWDSGTSTRTGGDLPGHQRERATQARRRGGRARRAGRGADLTRAHAQHGGRSRGAELIAFGAPNTENKDAELQPGF